MKTVTGKYSTAKIFTDLVEDEAVQQIRTLCDQSFTEGCRIRIMPDVHAGKGCTIGFTADLGDKVIPDIVGVDIGCGMLLVELGKLEVDYAKLDAVIRKGISNEQNEHTDIAGSFDELKHLYCYKALRNTDHIYHSIGTLGAGNHFIEADEDDEGNKYLVIHTGSRNLGVQVCEYYQKLAVREHDGTAEREQERKKLIRELKEAGRTSEISAALKQFEQKEYTPTLPAHLCYLTAETRNAYLHDMAICQRYAVNNRKVIADIILRELYDRTTDTFPHFETIHNYIDLEDNIIRKGAVSARKGERLLIPINMRDGSLICTGKGNEDWNCSAPHGAGRLFSRTAAKQRFNVSDYAEEMKGIYTTSVNADTLDECPMAYKPMESITQNIEPAVTIDKVIRPVYNFKAAEQKKY